jgi:hypothetical protein
MPTLRSPDDFFSGQKFQKCAQQLSSPTKSPDGKFIANDDET